MLLSLRKLIAAGLAFAALALPSLSWAAGSVRVEWLRNGYVYSAETISSSGTSTASAAAPDFGGVAGQLRIVPISGAVVINCCSTAPTATATNGIRLEAGQAPLTLNVSPSVKVAIIEAADAQAAPGLPSGASTAANQSTLNTSIGATSESAASSDTATSGLNGLVKRLLAKVTTFLAPVTPATATATQTLLLGCEYRSTKPTWTNTQQGAAQCGSRGSMQVTLFDENSTNGVYVANTFSDGLSNSTTSEGSLKVQDRPYLYNGSTWDRQFTCASTASVSVTAGNTTEIVALSGSTVVRVCSISLSMSAAGTLQFAYGTGTNCGTGTTALMAAMNLATATPWSPSAPTGGSLLRTASGKALCVAAVTGNVVGFITYAQY